MYRPRGMSLDELANWLLDNTLEQPPPEGCHYTDIGPCQIVEHPRPSAGGYVSVWHDHRRWQAHHIIYKSFEGDIPEGKCIRHRCDRPACISPDHLLLGDQIDNIRDRDDRHRNRQLAGEAHGQSKLTEGDVLEIRELHDSGLFTNQILADSFGVTDSHIRHIVNCRVWKHI